MLMGFEPRWYSIHLVKFTPMTRSSPSFWVTGITQKLLSFYNLSSISLILEVQSLFQVS